MNTKPSSKNYIELTHSADRFFKLNNSIFLLTDKTGVKHYKYQVRQPDFRGEVTFISIFHKENSETRGKYRYIGIITKDNKFIKTKKAFGNPEDVEFRLFNIFWKLCTLNNFITPKSMRCMVPVSTYKMW